MNVDIRWNVLANETLLTDTGTGTQTFAGGNESYRYTDGDNSKTYNNIVYVSSLYGNATITLHRNLNFYGTIVVRAGFTLTIKSASKMNDGETRIIKRMMENQPLIFLEDGAILKNEGTEDLPLGLYEDNDDTTSITCPMIECASGATDINTQANHTAPDRDFQPVEGQVGAITISNTKVTRNNDNKPYNSPEGMFMRVRGSKTGVELNNVTIGSSDYTMTNTCSGSDLGQQCDALTSAVVFDDTDISGDIDFTNCSFYNCKSCASGSAINMTQNVSFTGEICVANTTVADCDSAGYGGAFNFDAVATATATYGNDIPSGNGFGTDDSTWTDAQLKAFDPIYDNQGKNDGKGDLNILNTTFTNCDSGTGGAIHIGNNAKFDVVNIADGSELITNENQILGEAGETVEITVAMPETAIFNVVEGYINYAPSKLSYVEDSIKFGFTEGNPVANHIDEDSRVNFNATTVAPNITLNGDKVFCTLKFKVLDATAKIGDITVAFEHLYKVVGTEYKNVSTYTELTSKVVAPYIGGEEFEVTYKLPNVTEFNDVQASLTYDSSKITYVKNSLTYGFTRVDVTENTDIAGKINFNVSRVVDSESNPVTVSLNDHVLCKAKFTVNGGETFDPQDIAIEIKELGLIVDGKVTNLFKEIEFEEKLIEETQQESSSSSSSTSTITPAFTNCTASMYGGAIAIEPAPIVGTDAIADDMTYLQRYGIYRLNISGVSFTDCITLTTNSDGTEAGGVQCGGSLYLASPTTGSAAREIHTANIDNCVFKLNDKTGADTGGFVTIGADFGNSINFNSCTFTGGNVLENAGAIKIDSKYGYYGDFNFNDCSFSNCTAVKGGGAIFNGESSIGSLNVYNTTFNNCTTTGTETNKSASNGGAIANEGDINGNLVVDGCTFTGCTATNNGGTIYFGGESVAVPSDIDAGTYPSATLNTAAVIEDCKVTESTAGAYGGVVYTGGIDVEIKGTDLDGNKALNGGALAIVNGAKVTVTDGYIRNNKAVATDAQLGLNTYGTTYQKHSNLNGVGGGIYVADGASETDRSTFELIDSETTDVKSIGIYGNTASYAADDVFANGKNTQLTVPDVKNMNLTEHNRKVEGWFEDYAYGDTNYESQTAYYGKAVRFRTVSTTHEIGVNSQLPANDILATASLSDTYYTNNADTFICMTLGLVDGTMNVNPTIDADTADTDNFELKYTITNTARENTYTYYYYVKNAYDNYVTDKSGNKVRYEVFNGGTFTLTTGQTAEFISLEPGEYNVTEDYNNNDQAIYIKGATHNWKVVNGSGSGTNATVTQLPLSIANVEVVAEADSTASGRYTDLVIPHYIRSVDVNLKYYPRKVVNGKPADMSSEATTYTKTYSDDVLKEYLKNGSYTNFNYQKMIVDAGVQLQSDIQNNPDNVIDEYIMWTTQSAAVTNIENEGITGENVTNKGYAEDANKVYHTNQYGCTQDGTKWYDDTEDADGEKWVTYRNNNAENTDLEIENYPTEEQSPLVDEVTVWLFNRPKTYTFKYYAIDTDGAVVDKAVLDNNVEIFDADGNYVEDGFVVNNVTLKSANGTSGNGLYYNQRVGIMYATEEHIMNEDTVHLSNYGLPGYTDDVVTTADYIIVNGKTYYFQYWAFDEAGKEIATTERTYTYRVTKNTTLYPIYATQEAYTGKGVTTVENHKDYYFDENGNEMVRLNTIVNPYGYERDDANIKQVAAVYVDVKNYKLTDVQKANVRKYVEKLLASSYNVANFKITVSIKVTAKGLRYDVETSKGTSDKYPNLTNRNRIQIYAEFNKADLKNTRYWTYTAINYYAGER